MTSLSCDICGGKIVIEEGGIATCDNCDTEHSIGRMKEKAQEIKGAVDDKNTANNETFLIQEKPFLDDSNWEQDDNCNNENFDIYPQIMHEYTNTPCADMNISNAERHVECKELAIIQEIQKRSTLVQGCISDGMTRTVGLKTDGTVICTDAFENNDCAGELYIKGWEKVVAVSTGAFHTVGLLADGSAIAAGKNQEGQCNIHDWQDIVAISAGGVHTVGLFADGTVICTDIDDRNMNEYVRLIIGSHDKGQCNTWDWRDVVAISAGEYHTIGLRADGTLIAAGIGTEGQCDIWNWRDIVAISAGNFHTAGLKSDGTVITAGGNGGYRYDTHDWRDIVAVSAGGSHTAGLKVDGTVIVVGNNEFGQCDTQDWCDIAAVYAGFNRTIGLMTDGTVITTGNKGLDYYTIHGWRDIGPVPEKLSNQWKEDFMQIKNEERRQNEQSLQWISQGLCRHCGGTPGVFKKCKSCGQKI